MSYPKPSGIWTEPTTWLWVLAVTGAIGDGVTTMYGLTLGIPEANPVILALFPILGPASLFVVKVPPLLCCAFLHRHVRREWGVAAIAGLATAWLTVAALNALTIATRV